MLNDDDDFNEDCNDDEDFDNDDDDDDCRFVALS